MAHVHELPRCSSCREPASSELVDAQNISLGHFCQRCIGPAFKQETACERDLVTKIFCREENR